MRTRDYPERHLPRNIWIPICPCTNGKINDTVENKSDIYCYGAFGFELRRYANTFAPIFCSLFKYNAAINSLVTSQVTCYLVDSTELHHFPAHNSKFLLISYVFRELVLCKEYHAKVSLVWFMKRGFLFSEVWILSIISEKQWSSKTWYLIVIRISDLGLLRAGL